MKNFFIVFLLAAAGCAHRAPSTEEFAGPPLVDSRAPAGVDLAYSPFRGLIDYDGFFAKDPAGARRAILAQCTGKSEAYALLGNHPRMPRLPTGSFNLQKLYGFDRIWLVDTKKNSVEFKFDAPYSQGFPYGIWRSGDSELEIRIVQHPFEYVNILTLKLNGESTTCGLVGASSGGSSPGGADYGL